MKNNIIIGFLGSDKHEIILYLSRILYHLNKKVLLVDFAENEALTQSIPIPTMLKESNTYLDYRGIDFIRGENYYFNINEDYDYVLLDFGYNYSTLSSIVCDQIIYVTDLQLHNAKRIKIGRQKGDPKSHIIIKDVFKCKIGPENILREIHPKISIENVYIIEQDAIDIKFKIHSQYNQTFYFDKLSKSMKSFLQDIISSFDESLGKSQIQNAYKIAERGR